MKAFVQNGNLIQPMTDQIVVIMTRHEAAHLGINASIRADDLLKKGAKNAAKIHRSFENCLRKAGIQF